MHLLCYKFNFVTIFLLSRRLINKENEIDIARNDVIRI